MGVSANTLFHFTGRDSLEKILLSKHFRPSYSLERFTNVLPRRSYFYKAYIPIVCFCDLTITQLSNQSRHTKDFGKFGIGLKKEWGVKNGVSPVVYVHNKSHPSNQINKLVEELSSIKQNFPKDKVASELRYNMLELIKYLKPYSGRYQKNKIKSKEIIYYNEREWRFCPEDGKKKYNVLSAKIKENVAAVKRLNTALEKQRILKYEASDIKYIILEDSKDIPFFAGVINKMKINKNDRAELLTKIITLDEIKADF